ncbi:MAG: hypothetical protein EOP20_02295, partial [Hyphomicrobiales bacterium]
LVGAVKAGVKAVAGWLGFSESFTSQDGAPHRLYVTGTDARPVIVVASDETALDLLLKRGGEFEQSILKSRDAAKQSAIVNAQKDYEEAKRLQAALVKDPENAEATQSMKGVFKRLVTNLTVTGVGVSKVTPRTVIQSQPNGGMAGTVTANMLSKDRSTGTTPGAAKVVGWQHVRRIDRGQDWERVHLVSHQFGGPGRPDNLVPARKTDNSWMTTGPEAAIKAMFAENENIVLNYSVSTTGYYAGLVDADNNAIEGFPTGFRVSLHTMKKVGKVWQNDLPLNILPSRSFAPPPVVGTEMIDLKDAGYASLFRSLGVPSTIAHYYADAKKTVPFASEADCKQRVKAEFDSKRRSSDVKFGDVWDAIMAPVRAKKAYF